MRRSVGGRRLRFAPALLLFALAPLLARAAVSTIVIHPSAMGIWRTVLYDAATGGTYVTGTTTNGSYGAFTTGPAAPPAGFGSFHQHIGRNGSDGQRMETSRFNAKPFSWLASLSYSTYVTSTAGSLAPSIVMFSDIDGDGLMTSGVDQILTFEPKNQTGAVTLPNGVSAPDQCSGIPGCVASSAWQSWNARTGAWSLTTLGGASNGFDTLAHYQSDHPLAVLSTDRPSFQITTGFAGAVWNNFDGNIDAVRVNDTIYDFEDPPGPPDITTPAEGTTLYRSPVTISGTLRAESGAIMSGATITMREGSQTVATATTSGTGDWSATVTIPDGHHVISAQATAGSYTSPATTRAFDVAFKPVILTPAEGTAHSTVVDVSGTAGAGETISIADGSSTLGVAATAPSCNEPCPWSAGPFVFAEGMHVISAQASAGSTSSSPSLRTFTVDIRPSFLTPAPGSVRDSSPAISGVAGAGMTVRVYEGAALVGATGTPPGCQYPCAWTIGSSSFADGSHTITATATEGAITSESVSRSFTVDTVAPAMPSITTPAEGSTSSSNYVVVSGTADPGSLIHVYEGTIDKGHASADSNGRWSLTSTFPLGSHALFAVANDAAGNLSPSTPLRSFTVDFTTPSVPVITSPAQSSFVRSPVKLEGLAPTGTTVTLFEGSAVLAALGVGDGRWSVTLAFGDGGHAVYAKAADASGHTSAPSAVRAFTADSTAPSIQFNAFGRAAYVEVPFDSALLPGGSAGDNLGVDHVTLTYTAVTGGDPVIRTATCAVCPGRFASWSDDPGLPAGVYQVIARSYDRAGNVSSAVRSFFVSLGS